jgi:thioredoxin reductase
MPVDCAIIGGGPAGLNAALVLGRARRTVLLCDDNQPRNAVTQHSHGFITRDGVVPAEFRAIAQREIAQYPSVETRAARIRAVTRQGAAFELLADDGATVSAGTIILATGLRETLPAVAGIDRYYGRSLFNCPYCDGWELRDQPLVIVAESPSAAAHLPKVLYNWSRDLVVCTNGQQPLSAEQQHFFAGYGIRVIEAPIAALVGQAGQLERLQFANHPDLERTGGFVEIQRWPATTIGQDLGCATDDQGSIVTDELGRTNVHGVYAAGDLVHMRQAQLIWAAADGSRAAIGVNTDLTTGFFDQ